MTMGIPQMGRDKKSRVKKGLVSLLAVATVMGGTVSLSAETLKEALAAAYSSNPQLLAQRAVLRGTDEGVSRAKSGFLPNLQGTGTFRRGAQDFDILGDSPQNILGVNSQAESDALIQQILDNGDNVPFGFQVGDPFDQELAPTPQDVNSDAYVGTVQQNLFRGFQDRNLYKGAQQNVYAGRAQLLSVEQQVLLDAVTAYMDVFRDEAVVRLNENQVSVLERQLQASQDRFRVGEITRTDVAQSEARLEGAKSNLLGARATLGSSRARYRRVIGRAPGTLQAPQERPELPSTLDEALVLANEKAPGVQSAKFIERAAKYSVKQAKGALLPTVDLTGQYVRQNGISNQQNVSFDSVFNQTSVQVQVTVPLYAGGARHSDIRAAKQTHSQRRVEIIQAERVAQENAFAAWDQYRAAKAQITANEAQVRANEIALEGVEQEAAVGSRTTLDVLDAQQELLNSQVNLTTAKRNEAVAAYTLVSAVGALTARELSLDVELYNPEEHYDDVKHKLFGW